ncbi:guanine nucleotide-binding protein subunit alpha [Tulasnella sp. 419]|nr:guanine nucleotide-binding protein subunit alpha [Tulasnella sp. 419]
MGCIQSTEAIDHSVKAAHPTGKQKDKQEKDKQAEHEVKMLLLGAGDSGKTTIVKQMKLMHEGGYSDRERQLHKDSIFSSTISSMQAVLQAMPVLKVPLQPGNESRKEQILALPSYNLGFECLPKPISEALRGLWYDPGVRAVVNRSKEFQLNDSASYFFHALERMSSPSYNPTDQDILRSRVKTTGIIETTFRVGELTYRIYDVGGQRSERKKWIHCFDNVAVLVFMVSLSEYDQKLYESEDVNRMEEALTLFDSICNSRCRQIQMIMDSVQEILLVANLKGAGML